MAKQILTADVLRSRFSYNPVSGVFTRLIGVSGRNTKAGTVAGSKDNQGYLKITIQGQFFKAHRLAWLHVHGEWPKFEVDHINGNRSDNRIENLRDAPRGLNSQNERSARISNRSGFLGVCSPTKIDKKFLAVISVAGKSIRLGRFDCAEDAHKCYVDAKRRLHAGCTI